MAPSTPATPTTKASVMQADDVDVLRTLTPSFAISLSASPMSWLHVAQTYANPRLGWHYGVKVAPTAMQRPTMSGGSRMRQGRRHHPHLVHVVGVGNSKDP
eukprot:jgi/Tetstr1/455442/TSEL_042271.t1